MIGRGGTGSEASKAIGPQYQDKKAFQHPAEQGKGQLDDFLEVLEAPTQFVERVARLHLQL